MIRRSALAIALLLAACTAPVAPTGPAGEAPPLVRADEPVGTVTVRNASPAPITRLSFASCGAAEGPDRLGDGGAIAPGATRSVAVSAGCWDVRAGTEGAVAAFPGEDVAAGGTSVLTVEG